MLNLEMNAKNNKVLLTVNSKVSPCDITGCAYGVSLRFLQAARQCPPNSFLGIHAVFDPENAPQLFAFSDPKAEPEQEDYEWIYSGYAFLGDPTQASKNPEDDGRRVYAIRQKEQCLSKTRSGDYRGGYNFDFDSSSHDEFSELSKELKRVGAVLQVLAGEKSSDCNTVLLGISGPLTLKLRALFSLFIPGVVFSEITDGNDFSEGSKPLIYDVQLRFTSELLNEIMCSTPDPEKELDENGDCDCLDLELDDYSDEFDDDIASLDFSVRTYNVLKRAGVYTVSRLRKMSNEELMSIRNFSRKCLAEVRIKLSESNIALDLESESEPEPEPGAESTSGDELERLIGLQNVKKQVKKIAAYAKMKRDMIAMNKNTGSVVLNMEFVGNPGTGKTTVARILAGIFFETGLLKSKDLVEVGRADLVGKYVGHTADRVKSIFDRANGKVLFIDEAYSLVERDKGDFGDEAINTIVQEMENRRENTIVIFAGYTDEMKGLFSRNPGLRSRVPFSVEFTDYSPEEMLQITEKEISDRGFSLNEGAREQIASICADAAKQKETGNGRFCRNLAERAVLCYAERVYGGESEDEAAKDFLLRAEDFEEISRAKEKKKSNNIIGFCA